VVDKSLADIVDIAPATIASTIRSAVGSVPLGNYEINTTRYDYSIDKIARTISDIETLPVVVGSESILVQDVADIVRDYRSDAYTSLVTDQRSGYHYITMTVSKNPGTSIFGASDQAKEYLASVLEDDEVFAGISYLYANDIADVIRDDYSSVALNGLTTLALVFLAVFIFVGLKESLMATLSIPLAFFVTFIVLNYLGLSLNFLTNFSLIVTFGIAIDTIIVIIEAATEKHKLGFSPFHAALLAVREFKWPLIAGTATTCVVFIPLFVLPGVTGKFLSYIPITIFITLIAALVLSLVVNPVLYYLLTPKSKTYERHLAEEEVMDEETSVLLDQDREGKTEIPHPDDWRHRLFGSLGAWYQRLMSQTLSTKSKRRWVFW
jgi:multidrug efflux pump subunit AcrB